MERALDVSVSVLVREQSQKKCCGVEYHLFVLSATAAVVRRLHHRRRGLHHAQPASMVASLSMGAHMQKAGHTGCCCGSSSSSESSSWSSAPDFAWSPFAFPASSALFALAVAFFLFFFFCDLDRVPAIARQHMPPRCFTTTRDHDAEFASTSESCNLTYHFVVRGQMWLAQTSWKTRNAVATSWGKFISGGK